MIFRSCHGAVSGGVGRGFCLRVTFLVLVPPRVDGQHTPENARQDFHGLAHLRNVFELKRVLLAVRLLELPESTVPTVGAQARGRVEGGAQDLTGVDKEVLGIARQQELDVLLIFLCKTLLELLARTFLPPAQHEAPDEAELSGYTLGDPGLTADLDEGELIAGEVDTVEPVSSEGRNGAHGKRRVCAQGGPPP